MSQSVAGRVARPAVMFIAGLLAASALTSSVVAAPATVSSTLTRSVSCMGLNFHAIDGLTVTTWTGTRLAPGSRNGGDGYVLCDPGLPNKAVVRKVEFMVYDDDNAAEVRYCALDRIGLTMSTAADPTQVLAQVASTGMAETPGYVHLSTTAISHPTIDNVHDSYSLQCQLHLRAGHWNTDSGLVGASVTYTISSTNG